MHYYSPPVVKSGALVRVTKHHCHRMSILTLLLNNWRPTRRNGHGSPNNDNDFEENTVCMVPYSTSSVHFSCPLADLLDQTFE